MIPGILDDLCLDSLLPERLSSLAHAAQCLATAASALSEAARAAAESFTSEPVFSTQKDDSEGIDGFKDPISQVSEILTVPPVNLILLNPGPDPGTLSTKKDADYIEEYREETQIAGDDLVDEQTSGTQNDEPGMEAEKDVNFTADLAPVAPVEGLQEALGTVDPISRDELPVEITQTDSNSVDPVVTTETECLVDPKQPYLIIVENESDGLLSACTLIGKYQQVVCYVPCGTPPLLFYKQLVGITGISVYFAERISAAKRDTSYKQWLQKDSSVILIPGTISSEVVMEGNNSWVIHIGWPSNREKYLSQLKTHQAKNNIIIAPSIEIDLYPSCASIMAITQAWPKLGDSFTASVHDLRPSFENTLAKISDDVKEKVYADWIQSHGVYGPRYVKSWDSVMLVQQANHYLLHVLKYGLKRLASSTPEEKLLPEVSPGFVAQNLLESAVQAGALHVKHDDAGLNHISSLAQADLVSPAPSTAKIGTSSAGVSVPSTPGQLLSGLKTKELSKNPRVETGSEQADFELNPGHTYFTIEEDFDAIPLICFIAGHHDKSVCFLEGQGSLRHYQKLFDKILQSKSVVIAPEATNSEQANYEAAARFASSSVPAMLLLTYGTTNLPSPLREKRVGCCVYWGFHLPLKQAKKHRDQLLCSSTTMVTSKAQQNELKRHSTDITEHPSARTLLDLGTRSLLWPMRNTTVSVLMTEETIIKGLYVNRIYGLGTVSRTERSAEEVVRMANQYAAKVLLRGTLDDGSENFPPVAGRLPIPRTVVERFSLQPAINVGLASVG
ncbi:hypothetical protein OPQ81_002586 [Rhizoctonia solani]|nr:hypothetical protein OPQ81_002586 [Rhizoctonia solani]